MRSSASLHCIHQALAIYLYSFTVIWWRVVQSLSVIIPSTLILLGRYHGSSSLPGQYMGCKPYFTNALVQNTRRSAGHKSAPVSCTSFLHKPLTIITRRCQDTGPDSGIDLLQHRLSIQLHPPDNPAVARLEPAVLFIVLLSLLIGVALAVLLTLHRSTFTL